MAFGPGTVLVDTDPQRSAEKWGERRSAPFPTVVPQQFFADRGARELVELSRADKVKTLIFDGRPRASEAEAQLAELADVIVVPSSTTILDLEAVEGTFEIAKALGKPGIAVLTKAKTRIREYAEAQAWLAERVPDWPIVTLSDLVIYHRALNAGAAVSEVNEAGADVAAQEINQLVKLVKGAMK